MWYELVDYLVQSILLKISVDDKILYIQYPRMFKYINSTYLSKFSSYKSR